MKILNNIFTLALLFTASIAFAQTTVYTGTADTWTPMTVAGDGAGYFTGTGLAGYDDDAAGSGSNPATHTITSPVIDLTTSFGAGETTVQVDANLAYQHFGSSSLVIEYWDADAAAWVALETFSATTPNGTTYNDATVTMDPFLYSLDISTWTATQLAGFQLQYTYDDGNGWQWGYASGTNTVTSFPNNHLDCDEPCVETCNANGYVYANFDEEEAAFGDGSNPYPETTGPHDIIPDIVADGSGTTVTVCFDFPPANLDDDMMGFELVYSTIDTGGDGALANTLDMTVYQDIGGTCTTLIESGLNTYGRPEFMNPTGIPGVDAGAYDPTVTMTACVELGYDAINTSGDQITNINIVGYGGGLCDGCGVDAFCTTSGIYPDYAAANAATDGCNPAEVRDPAGATETYCHSFTTPASMPSNEVGFDAVVLFGAPGCSGGFLGETLQEENCGAFVPVAGIDANSGFDLFTLAPNTTYEYCMTWETSACLSANEPCVRPFFGIEVVTCSTGPASFCYGDNMTNFLGMVICPDAPGEKVEAIVNAGGTEAGWDDVTVYSAPPGTPVAGLTTILDSSPYDVNDMTGYGWDSPVDECLYFVFNSDGGVSCGSGARPPFEIECYSACPSTYSITPDVTTVCSGGTVTLTPDVCLLDLHRNDFGTGHLQAEHLDFDYYIYNDGTTFEAPGGYDPLPATQEKYPLSDANVAPWGAGGNGTLGWGPNACDPFAAAVPVNQTCDPIVVTLFMVPFDYNVEDPTGTFGTYLPASDPRSCGVLRFDITVDPEPFTVAVVAAPDCAGTVPSVELRAADGTVCSSVTGTAGMDMLVGCASAQDGALAWDFTADWTSICTPAPTNLVNSASSACACLPVELLSFDGRANGEVNQLFWSTASEENTSHFEVEASADGQTFNTIGEVNAAGFSADVRNYTFNDERPMAVSYYRLRMVDLDGTYEYTDVIRIERPIEGINIGHVRPVPTKGQAVIQFFSNFNGTANFVITDVNGRVLSMQNIEVAEGTNEHGFDLGQYADGVYFVSLISGDFRSVQRVVKSGF